MALIAFTLFLYPVETFAYYSSALNKDGDDYIRFGNSEFPSDQAYDMSAVVQVESRSAQWVNITVQFWNGIIEERNIDKFLVLANGKLVHFFYPERVEDDSGTLIWSGYYVAKPSIPELIGTEVFFQIVAVDSSDLLSEGYEKAVAWSNITETIKMKPLPVRDEEAISALWSIYSKLQDLYDMTLGELQSLYSMAMNRLDRIIFLLENLFVPSAQVMADFEASIDNFMDKMPMNELVEEMDNITQSMEDSRKNLKQPGSNLQLGGQFEFIPGDPRSRVYFLDLTAWRDQVLLFRSVMEAALWVLFFHLLFNYLTPKPRV